MGDTALLGCLWPYRLSREKERKLQEGGKGGDSWLVRECVSGFHVTVTIVPGRNNLVGRNLFGFTVSKVSVHMTESHTGAMVVVQLMVVEVFISWKTSGF